MKNYLKKPYYKNELFRVTENNQFRFIDIEEIVRRCYVMTSGRYEMCAPLGIPEEDIFINNMVYQSDSKHVERDSYDEKPYIENVDLNKAFKKRNKRLTIKRISPDSMN